MTTTRRAFLLGLGTALAAPAVVRADSLMKLWVPPAPKLIASMEDVQNGLLDDYEEGYWTPTVNWSDTRVGRIKFEHVQGRYVKIGKKVFLS